MAADPAISERVYQELRRRLLAGAFRLRQRLDVGRIAAEMRASATPVREALTRLASEGLIAARPARGFFAMLWSEAELKALYEWRGTLARLAVEARGQSPPPIPTEASPGDYAFRVRVVLARIEEGANPELKRAAANADDRLHGARAVEEEALSGCEEELDALEATARAGTARALVTLVKRYHTRRIGHVGAIRERALLRALAPNGG